MTGSVLAESTAGKAAPEIGTAALIDEIVAIVSANVTGCDVHRFIVNGETLTTADGRDRFMTTHDVSELLRARARDVRAALSKALGNE